VRAAKGGLPVKRYLKCWIWQDLHGAEDIELHFITRMPDGFDEGAAKFLPPMEETTLIGIPACDAGIAAAPHVVTAVPQVRFGKNSLMREFIELWQDEVVH
jgi:hypothetical protein